MPHQAEDRRAAEDLERFEPTDGFAIGVVEPAVAAAHINELKDSARFELIPQSLAVDGSGEGAASAVLAAVEAVEPTGETITVSTIAGLLSPEAGINADIQLAILGTLPGEVSAMTVEQARALPAEILNAAMGEILINRDSMNILVAAGQLGSGTPQRSFKRSATAKAPSFAQRGGLCWETDETLWKMHKDLVDEGQAVSQRLLNRSPINGAVSLGRARLPARPFSERGRGWRF